MAADPFFKGKVPVPAPVPQQSYLEQAKSEILQANFEGQGVTREELNEFLFNVSKAVRSASQLPGTIPILEASRHVIAHFLGDDLLAFDQVHFFMFQGVKVYEAGKVKLAQHKEKETIEQRIFGQKHEYKE